jgi:CBS domain-containing protein
MQPFGCSSPGALGRKRVLAWVAGACLVPRRTGPLQADENWRLTSLGTRRYDPPVKFIPSLYLPHERFTTMIKMTGTVGSVLKQKGRELWFVTPDQTVYDAIEKMADKGVGALLVMTKEKLVGIISERDYTRKVILKGRSSKTTLVKEIMTSPVIFVASDTAVDECMVIITKNRIRHLPVMENERVLGVVSIGDLVKWVVSEQEETIEHLQNYISTNYPA